ncbi:Uncharacterised protein [uncultured archaeon]|nr:Uncharacterised protein [uncultured archaeon]
MRFREIFAIFILLLVIIAGISIPLWWDYAAPHILGLPQYIEGIINGSKGFIDTILNGRR